MYLPFLEPVHLYNPATALPRATKLSQVANSVFSNFSASVGQGTAPLQSRSDESSNTNLSPIPLGVWLTGLLIGAVFVLALIWKEWEAVCHSCRKKTRYQDMNSRHPYRSEQYATSQSRDPLPLNSSENLELSLSPAVAFFRANSTYTQSSASVLPAAQQDIRAAPRAPSRSSTPDTRRSLWSEFRVFGPASPQQSPVTTADMPERPQGINYFLPAQHSGDSARSVLHEVIIESARARGEAMPMRLQQQRDFWSSSEEAGISTRPPPPVYQKHEEDDLVSEYTYGYATLAGADSPRYSRRHAEQWTEI